MRFGAFVIGLVAGLLFVSWSDWPARPLATQWVLVLGVLVLVVMASVRLGTREVAIAVAMTGLTAAVVGPLTVERDCLLLATFDEPSVYDALEPGVYGHIEVRQMYPGPYLPLEVGHISLVQASYAPLGEDARFYVTTDGFLGNVPTSWDDDRVALHFAAFSKNVTGTALEPGPRDENIMRLPYDGPYRLEELYASKRSAEGLRADDRGGYLEVGAEWTFNFVWPRYKVTDGGTLVVSKGGHGQATGFKDVQEVQQLLDALGLHADLMEVRGECP